MYNSQTEADGHSQCLAATGDCRVSSFCEKHSQSALETRLAIIKSNQPLPFAAPGMFTRLPCREQQTNPKQKTLSCASSNYIVQV